MPSLIDIVIDAVWRGRGATRRAKQDLGDIDESAEKTSRAGRNLAASLTAVGVAFGTATFAARELFQLIEAGAGLELTEMRFDRLAQSVNTTSDALRRDLRDATAGMLSDAQAMALATDLIGLGLADTADEAVRLGRIVTELDADIGELTLALANQTTRRFDQLGISVVGFDERLEELKQTMSDEDAFTMAFLEQAEAQIERVGGVSDTTAGDVRRLRADWAEFVNEVERAAAQEFGGILGDITGGTGQRLRRQAEDAAAAVENVEDLNRAFQELNETAETAGRGAPFEPGVPPTFRLFSEDDFRQAAGTLVQELARVTDSADEFDTQARRIFGDELPAVMEELGVTSVSTLRALARAANAAGVDINEMNAAINELDIPADEWQEYADSVSAASDADRAMIQSSQALTEAMRLQREGVRITAEEFEQAMEGFEERFAPVAESIQAEFEAANERMQRFVELPAERADLFAAFQSDLTDITEREEERRAELTEQHEQRRTDLIAEYGRSRAQEEEDWLRRRRRQEEQLQDDIAGVRADSEERRAELREDANDRLADLEQDHADRMQDIIDNATGQLRQAASRLDAAAVARIEEQRDKALADEVESHQEQRAEILETLEERLEEEREAEQERINELRENLDERQRIEEEDRRIRLQRMEEAHQRQLAELDDSHRDRIRQIEQQAQEERNERTRQYQLEHSQLVNFWDQRQQTGLEWMQTILDQEEAWWAARAGGGDFDTSGTGTSGGGDGDDDALTTTGEAGVATRFWMERTALRVANPSNTQEANAWAQFFNTLSDQALAEWIETHSDIDVPGYLHGTSYVPRTGLAMLHEGEAVLDRQRASLFRAGGMSMGDVNVTVYEAQRPGDTAREVRRELERIFGRMGVEA